MANRFDVIVLSSISWSCLRHVFLALALLGLTSCAGLSQRYYSAEPIEAWVVDEKTGKPLEGVIVVAHWKLMRGTVAGRVPAGTMMLLETVTDANGRFSFPAWGPLENASEGILDHEDPMLILFKSGYRQTGLSNHYGIRAEDKPSKRKSEWSGKTIKMTRFEGTPEQYASHVAERSRFIDSTLDWTWNRSWSPECNIAKTPLLAQALDRENSEMEQRGFRKGGFLLDRSSIARLVQCGVAMPELGDR